jgi:hypothetical protein
MISDNFGLAVEIGRVEKLNPNASEIFSISELDSTSGDVCCQILALSRRIKEKFFFFRRILEEFDEDEDDDENGQGAKQSERVCVIVGDHKNKGVVCRN